MELNGTDATKAAFIAAMVEVQAVLPSVVRAEGATSKDGRNYKYADLTAYLSAARALLKQHGLCFIAAPSTDARDNSLVLRSMLAHKDGATLTVITPLVVGQYVDMQGFGSAVTYARRYVFSAMFNFAVEDDDGAAAAVTPRNVAVVAPVTTSTPASNEPVSPVADRVAKIKVAPPEHLELLTRLVANVGTPGPVIAAAKQRIAELQAAVVANV
jgi:hypothetical protein